jgi:hypothetical protein
MRKLLILPLFLSAPLATGIAQAAPAEQPKCNHYAIEKVTEKDSAGKDVSVRKVENGAFPAGTVWENCFADEIFVLDGDQKITVTTPGTPANPGNPTAMPPIPATPAVPPSTTEVDLVNCKIDPGPDKMAGTPDDFPDAKDCVIGRLADQLKGLGYEAAAQKALELVKSKTPGIEYDEVVLFSADFQPGTATGALGPLFFRANHSTSNQPINPVANIAPMGVLNKVDRDPAKPYVGVVSAGNVKAYGATPWTGNYAACGTAPRRPVDNPSPSEQQAAALCAPGLYSAFDALAQATANIYGPYLGVDAAVVGKSFSTMPLIKGTLVAEGGMDTVVSKFPSGGPSTNVWNAFLNTQGSILGGNTWRDSGNGTFSVTRPPAFQGVSAPFEGGQVLRFTNMDLYLLGLISANDVGVIQSFITTTPGQVFQPAVGAFSAAVGPHMGTRVSGVSLRGTPRAVNFFNDVAPINGGERQPTSDVAPQHIRQLWVLVTKPKRVMDAAAALAGAGEAATKALATDLRTQIDQLELLQRFRAEYNRYFYTLTGYRGRVLTHSEKDVDDMGYWEFGDRRDDPKEFVAGGGLQLQIPGPEEVPNSGGKQLSVLRVVTTGSGGTIAFNPVGRTIKISGSTKTPAANNLLTIRMRLPNEPGLKDKLKGRITFQGPQGDAAIEFPVDENAFLLADGVFHNYSVDLTKTPFTGDKEFNKFVLAPAIGADKVDNIEIEFIRVSWIAATNLKDSDLGCNKEGQADGWLDLEDNCKALYNPDQADGNGDGVGDACEDYDGDNVVNRCDNCPTVTNSSQRDGNNNALGDACDGDKPSDCFFQTSAVGGPVSPTSAVVWATGIILGVIGTAAVRRRRRRR